MKLRYTRPALSDLEQIIDYIALRSPQGARRVARELHAAESRFVRFPLSGSLTDVPAIRRIGMPRLPYLIFYEVAESEIIVHAVRHGARDPAMMPGQA